MAAKNGAVSGIDAARETGREGPAGVLGDLSAVGIARAPARRPVGPVANRGGR